MKSNGVVLDACVLVNAAVRDTLLRLAQKELFTPYWSNEIMGEVIGVLQRKMHKSPEQTNHLVEQLRIHFEEAWVAGCQDLVPKMQNDAKDRHVLACAVKSGARLIVTFNVRHFRPDALEPWLVEARHPDDFLADLYRRQPQVLTDVLREQAAAIQWDLNNLLTALRKGLPEFAALATSGLSGTN